MVFFNLSLDIKEEVADWTSLSVITDLIRLEYYETINHCPSAGPWNQLHCNLRSLQYLHSIVIQTLKPNTEDLN